MLKILPGLLLINIYIAAAAATPDPTRPTDPAAYFGNNEPSASGWSLQSILSSPQRRIAIINGSRVREGDRIGAAQVIRITPTQVVLNTGERTLTLRMQSTRIKVSP